MELIESKKLILDYIKNKEGNAFKCDENEIMDEFKFNFFYTRNFKYTFITISWVFLLSLLIVALVYTPIFFILSLIPELIVVKDIVQVIFGMISIYFANYFSTKYLKDANKLLKFNVFSIVLFNSGFYFILEGLKLMFFEIYGILLIISLIAMVFIKINKNYLLLINSILIISGCFVYYTYFYYYFILIHIYVMIFSLLMTFLLLNEAKIYSKKMSDYFNPIFNSIYVSLIIGLFILTKEPFSILIKLADKKYVISDFHKYNWITSIVLGLNLLYIVNYILKVIEIKDLKSKNIIFIITVLVIALLSLSPSIIGSLNIVLLCFIINYKTGFITSVGFLIFFIFCYFYYLDIDMSDKSLIFISLGLLFTLFYYLFNKFKLKINGKI